MVDCSFKNALVVANGILMHLAQAFGSPLFQKAMAIVRANQQYKAFIFKYEI